MVIGLLVNIASFFAYGLVVMWLIRQGKATLLRKEEGGELPVAEQVENEKSIGFWGSFREGIRFLGKTTPLPWVIAIGFLWNVLLFGPLGFINPILAKELLGGSALGYGLLTAANATGFTLGLVIIGGVNWKWPMAVTCAVVVAVQGLLYVLIGLAPGIVVTVLLLFLGGLITAPTDVFFKRIRQKLVPVTMQGRVTSVSSSLGFVGSPLGALIAGIVLQMYGNQVVGWLLAGCGFLLFLTVGFIATRRSMRII